MNINVGNILIMKKKHPCGSNEFKVIGTGMDFKLKCLGCGHEVIVNRFKTVKNIKSIK